LLVVGIAASGAYGSVNQAALKPGQSMQVGGYTLTYTGMRSTTGPNYVDTAARLVVSRGGSTKGTLYPAVRDFTDHTVKTQSNEVDIRHDLRGVDVYAILQGADPSKNEVVIKALVNPMVSLIWLAGLVFVLGAAITIWPDPREARQLARRYSTALAKEA
jgi:cytochrome c-type biogenesis protein CcmF